MFHSTRPHLIWRNLITSFQQCQESSVQSIVRFVHMTSKSVDLVTSNPDLFLELVPISCRYSKDRSISVNLHHFLNPLLHRLWFSHTSSYMRLVWRIWSVLAFHFRPPIPVIPDTVQKLARVISDPPPQLLKILTDRIGSLCLPHVRVPTFGLVSPVLQLIRYIRTFRTLILHAIAVTIVDTSPIKFGMEFQHRSIPVPCFSSGIVVLLRHNFSQFESNLNIVICQFRFLPKSVLSWTGVNRSSSVHSGKRIPLCVREPYVQSVAQVFISCNSICFYLTFCSVIISRLGSAGLLYLWVLQG